MRPTGSIAVDVMQREPLTELDIIDERVLTARRNSRWTEQFRTFSLQRAT